MPTDFILPELKSKEEMHSSPCQELNTNLIMESFSCLPATMEKQQKQQVPRSPKDASRSTFSHPLHQQHQHQQQQQQNQHQSQRRRRVAFSENTSVIPLMSPLDRLSTQEQSALWYHVTDLDHFRTEVRDLCRKMRVSSEPVQESCVGTSTYSLGAHFHTRGLEQRACLERQRRKYLAARCILRAQSKVESGEHLAVIAHKCTAWATVLAREEAARDVIRAYGPEIISIDDTEDTTDGTTTPSSPIKSSSIAPIRMNTGSNVKTSPDKRGLAELLQEAAGVSKSASASASASAEPSPIRRRLNTDGPVFGICRI
jgi:hypothetical protein